MSRTPIRALVAITAVTALVLGGCGGDDGTADTDGTTTTVASTTSTTVAGLGQPAVWPAADVVFTTPEAAAQDFVTQVLGVPAVIGEYQAGDSRSGEIEVFSPGEGGSATKVVRGLLLLRQLGPDDGWFVLAAVNDNAKVTTPESASKVAAGKLAVSGVARGFEGSVVVSAFVAGDTEPLDQVVTQGGSMETPEPFTVELDVSDAPPGSTVVLLVRGGVGLETDPGEFGAIPVVIAG
jgi:hypothetical protein